MFALRLTLSSSAKKTPWHPSLFFATSERLDSSKFRCFLLRSVHPVEIDGWNTIMEVDASDDVPFQMGDFSVNQPLNFQGCNLCISEDLHGLQDQISIFIKASDESCQYIEVPKDLAKFILKKRRRKKTHPG